MKYRNQCPSGLSFISTDTDEYTATVSTRGVNALLGFPSFLRYFFMPSHLRWFFVSIPFWAFLHFYKKTKNWKENSKEVSMPFWAFLHFYQDNGDCYDERMDLCQCPSGLSFISTDSSCILVENALLCQCPSGLSFISTQVVDDNGSSRFVSMPFWAFLHFY